MKYKLGTAIGGAAGAVAGWQATQTLYDLYLSAIGETTAHHVAGASIADAIARFAFIKLSSSAMAVLALPALWPAAALAVTACFYGGWRLMKYADAQIKKRLPEDHFLKRPTFRRKIYNFMLLDLAVLITDLAMTGGALRFLLPVLPLLAVAGGAVAGRMVSTQIGKAKPSVMKLVNGA